ncbi:MAG: cation:proton antiporter [Opitutales bacterium]
MMGIDFIQDLGIVLLVAGAAGWVFHRFGLSVVVGYLLAGIIIGPYTPPFPLVEDIDRIQTLANVGLVFLMFSIGMGLSLTRLRRLGFPIVLATALIAILLFTGWQALGSAFGLTQVQSLFFAGMWVSSSSAIIGKVLQERGLTHQRSGQLALGVTVLEDVVAIVTLTVLLSYVGIGQEDAATIPETIGIFGAFVIFMAITGLLLVPRLLRILGPRAGAELQTVIVGALLMLLAVFAQRAGYSLALGAFLLGAIVAETPQKGQVEKSFAGLRYVFSAVFFVAIGMLIDVAILGEVWLHIIAVAFLIIVGRVVAAYFALILIGAPTRDAVRAGLALTPMGEFGFIIAQAGIIAAVVPNSFYPLAVGVSLLTALACPVLVSRSDQIARGVEKLEPRFLRNGIEYYQNWLERISGLPGENRLWSLTRRRLIQIALGLLFVSGLLIAAEPVYAVVAEAAGEDLLFPYGTAVLFWGALGVIALFPLFATWRNISAVSLLMAEATARGRKEKVLPFIVERGIKAVAILLLLIWLWALLPLGPAAVWVFAALVVWGILMFVLFRRRLVLIHSQVEIELQELMSEGYRKSSRALPPWLQGQKDFHLNISECVVPDNGICGGKSLGELALRTRFGCSIVGIDRQGYVIGNPGPETILYPRDRLLLLGSKEELEAARRELTRERRGGAQEAVPLDDVQMESVVVPLESPRTTRTLAELDINRVTGIQVAGIQRQNELKFNPGGNERIQPADELLVLGSPEQITKFRRWLMPDGESESQAPND